MHSHMTTPRSLITSFPHMATCSEQHRKIRRECSHAAQTIPCRVARHAMISSNRPSLNNRGDYRPPLTTKWSETDSCFEVNCPCLRQCWFGLKCRLMCINSFCFRSTCPKRNGACCADASRCSEQGFLSRLMMMMFITIFARD